MDTNIDSPANPSDPDNDGADPQGSPAGNPAAGGATVTEDTLEQIVQRRVQSHLDQNLVLLQNGQTQKMNPVVTKFLGEYEKLLGPGSKDDDDDGDGKSLYSGFLDQNDPQPVKKNSKLEEIGRKALQNEVMGKLTEEAEKSVIADVWAEDVRALFADFKGVKFDVNDPLIVKITKVIDDRSVYPETRAGWRLWRKDADALRTKYLNGTPSEGDAGDDNSSGADADKTRAASKKKQPVVGGGAAASGTGLAYLVDLSKKVREGKATGKEFLEALEANKSTR